MPDFEKYIFSGNRASFGRISITIPRSGMWDNGGAFTLGDGGFVFLLVRRKLRKEKSCARAMGGKCAAMESMAYCPYILDEEYGGYGSRASITGV